MFKMPPTFERRKGAVTRLPELIDLERLLDSLVKHARVEVMGQAQVGELDFPLYAVSLGSTDPEAPVLGLFAGVHGLERIGTQVLLSFLQTVDQLLTWDRSFQELLQQSRLLFMPLVNPGGMFLRSRANPNGVDLMRNAPVHAEKMSPLQIYGGQRFSSKLPWYRGPAGAPMEKEAQALCDFVRKEVFSSKVAITVDVHSGFGSVDRIWFPYAKTKRPFPNVSEVFAIKNLLDRTYPNHIYTLEPQSRQYTTHGDLWDYLYDEHRKIEKESVFIPLALELGSWIWVRKNVKQIFSLLGAFNPMTPHRLSRTLRRHLIFFEFLHRAVVASESWARLAKDQKDSHRRRALELWYG